jgi:hypothetical protein
MGFLARSLNCGVFGLVVLAVSACGTSAPEVKASVKKPRSKEYFAEAEYGDSKRF